MKVISKVSFNNKTPQTIRLIIPKVIVQTLQLEPGLYVLWEVWGKDRILLKFFDPKKDFLDETNKK